MRFNIFCGNFYHNFFPQEMVGQFHSEFYVINGMVLESRKRREHLSEEDLQKNKAIMESLTKGNTQGLDGNGEVNFWLMISVFLYI